MKHISSRITPVAVSLVLVAAACGGADGASESPVPTVDTTVPPGESNDGPADGPRPPAPIEVVRGGGSGGLSTAGGSAETATAVAGDDVAGEILIAPWSVDYVVGEGLRDLPTDDLGYVFDPADEVTADQVASIAAALGVVGEPVRTDDGFGVSWRVGPDDGSGPSLWLYDDGQQAWSYNGPWSDDVEACAVSVDSEGNETSDCPEPVPPTGVPTADEAQQRATDLLTALGVDAGGLDVETFADEWFASVEATDDVDGRAPVRSWSFGFGEEGSLEWAGGTLAEPSPVGPYPLVDLDTAVARLSDGFYGGFGGVAVAEPDLAVVSEIAPEEGEASEPAVEEDRASEEPVGDPIAEPSEPWPEGEPVVVTLVDVQPDLWWAWDADGAVWLLPAYRFIDTDGAWHVVPAVTDEFLIQTEPGDIGIDEPIPVEPDGGIGDGAEPLPDAPTEVPGTEPGEINAPADAAALLDELVGLSIEEFTVEAEALGFQTRIVQRDGEFLPVTEDYSDGRVNVAVEGPQVVAVDSIG